MKDIPCVDTFSVFIYFSENSIIIRKYLKKNKKQETEKAYSMITMYRENILVSFILVLSVQARNTVRSVDSTVINIQTNDNSADIQNTGSISMLSHANDKDTWDSRIGSGNSSTSSTVDTSASGKI